ncbi:MAG TPA: hypothetical protein VM434_13200, partial [Beijerinckiaceae bacterium]|nr:hypothetical protein [Beijerinckiaceae bacterium]
NRKRAARPVGLAARFRFDPTATDPFVPDRDRREARNGGIPADRKALRTLDEMRRNPRADWTIADIEGVCRRLGLVCTPPSHGSHYKVSSPKGDAILTIPARRPIKPVYIRQFVDLARAVVETMQGRSDG